MRIVFMGTPEFAVPALQKLHMHHEVVGVVTAPDRPAGRGKKLSMSAVKEAALALAIPVLQPLKLKDPEFQAELNALQADLFVVVAFRMLPESVWSMPPKGTINLHGSLLPAYRGAAPINRAIMHGEAETGLTTFFIERDIDTGAVIDRCTLGIGPDEDAGSLHDRMMLQGADLLLDTVNKISEGKASAIPQLQMTGNDPLPKAPKIFREDCRIDWNQKVTQIHNHVRGLSPYPSAYTEYIDPAGNLVALKIFETQRLDTPASGPPGSFAISDNTITVNASDGQLAIRSLQAPGKRRLHTAEFLRGNTFGAEPLTFLV